MASREQRPDVAVFIDFENVYVSVRDKLDANPNFEMIMDRCEDLGRVVIARAYADWYRYPRVTSALYANGVEPMYVPTYYYDRDLGRTGRAIKNSVDMNLCIDAMKTLYTNPNIEKFVLCTGDRDFIPLVNSIRQQGKEVIIIGIGGAASSHLAQSADEFIFYETLVGKKPVDLQNDQPKARMPEKVRETEYEQVSNGRDHSAAPRETVAPREPQQEDIYAVLVRAIHLARERDFVCSFGSLKLLMKELMGGEFREDKYRDASGKPFAKFKDFVMEAERRGKVIVFTSGAMNEVFLPGEDPYKLSRFAIDLKEEPAAPSPVATPEEHTMKDRPSVSNRRRRRRSRNVKSQNEAAQPLGTDEAALEADEFDTAFAEIQEEDAPVNANEDRFEDLLERLDEEQAHVEELEDTVIPDLDSDLASSPEAAEQQLEQAFALATQELSHENIAEQEAEIELFSPEPQESALVVYSEQDDNPSPLAQPEPVFAEAAEAADTIALQFREEEWQALRDALSRSTRPLSFMHIHDLLREARNNAGLQRTNEELRTMIKQAINSGILSRSGKGSRVAYRLAPVEQLDQEAHLNEAEQDTSMSESELVTAIADPNKQPPSETPAELPPQEPGEPVSDPPAHPAPAELPSHEYREPVGDPPVDPTETSAVELSTVTGFAAETATETILEVDSPQPAKTSRSSRSRKKKAAQPESAPISEAVEVLQAVTVEETKPVKPPRRRRPAKKEEEKA